MSGRRTAARAALVVLGLTLAACGSSAGAASDERGDDRLAVVASFYPLAYLAERVGGDRVAVTNLSSGGVEPHDLELTPKDVAAIDEADLVVYLAGFQPAVDDAVTAQAADASFDAGTAADLSLTYTPEDGDEATAGDGAVDPHFWLDPTRYAAVATALASRLGSLSPADAPTFTRNAEALGADLTALDRQWSEATASCAHRQLVTSHTAFGYLAQRYGFTQVGITGLSPEAEPSPKALAATIDLVRAEGVTTIYFETLVSPDIAATVARETGVSTAVLDPIEGLTDSSAGDDYFGVMRADLRTVVAGQGCR